MTALLERDFPLLEHFHILVLNLTLVGKENVKALDLCENSGTNTAFSSSKNNNTIIHNYLIFNNANVATANISSTSQKRATIFASGIGCEGQLMRAGTSIF